MQKAYTEHKDKVVETKGRFKHVMAISLDPTTKNTRGLIRAITSREGNVKIKGYLDRSELYLLKGSSLDHFEIGERLVMKNEEEILRSLIGKGDFIGLEDPDIWVDEESGLMHLYFTVPVRPGQVDSQEYKKIQIHLGHAEGKDLDSLQMTAPVLMDTGDLSAKEVSITPKNSQGFRYNLVESRDRRGKITYSTIQVAVAYDMGKPWEYGEVAFHPKERGLSWIAGHASPGPLFDKEFIDLGEGKLLGVINGREANRYVGGQTVYGTFSIGLFVYDYERGKIEWVSEKPFIQDSEAETITFASHFVETNKGEGILYAHVDDSFVRAYTLNAKSIKALLP